MGAPCQIQFYANSEQHGQNVFQAVTDCIETLEGKYSRYRKHNLIANINRSAGRGQPTPIDSETLALLHYADQCYQESDQLFDMTSGVLRNVWHFNRQALPTDRDIKQLLPLIGWPKVKWDEHEIYLPQVGMELDFGGFVKEYAADTAVALCQKMGVQAGIIELGGDIKVIGPLPDGSGWPVAIRNPTAPDKKIVELTLKSGALASSGDYERFQLINGVRYSHLLNPKTGWPVTGLRAASVIAEHCVVAGSLATICMLKGPDGLKWLQQQNMAFLCCQNNGKVTNQL